MVNQKYIIVAAASLLILIIMFLSGNGDEFNAGCFRLRTELKCQIPSITSPSIIINGKGFFQEICQQRGYDTLQACAKACGC